jgi:hypothetical protein
MSTPKNPVSFEIPNISPFCNCEKHIKNAKRDLLTMFQQFWKPHNLPRSCGISVEITKRGFEGYWVDSLGTAKYGPYYSARINIEHIVKTSQRLETVLKNRYLEMYTGSNGQEISYIVAYPVS